MPATAADLDGWVGPVVYEGEGATLIGPDNDYPVGLWCLSRPQGWEVMSGTMWCYYVETEHLALDTTRPEVIDRLMRVYALPEWQRAYPGVVACSVARARAGLYRVFTLRTPWVLLDNGRWVRPTDIADGYIAVIPGKGWRALDTAGPETGAAGKLAADTAALARGCALDNGDHLLLPYGPGDVRRWSLPNA
jgi:hypothetical protein